MGAAQKRQNDLVLFPRQTFNVTVIQVYAPATDAKEDEVKRFCEDLQDLLELTPKKKKMSLFRHREPERKSRKSRDGTLFSLKKEENPRCVTSTEQLAKRNEAVTGGQMSSNPDHMQHLDPQRPNSGCRGVGGAQMSPEFLFGKTAKSWGWMLAFFSKECECTQSSTAMHLRSGYTGKFYTFESVSPSVTSDSATLWTVARQVPLSMGPSRQEYWSGFSFPAPGDLPHPGTAPGSPALQAESLSSEPPEVCIVTTAKYFFF